jgi:hypothetical protein
MPRDIRRHVAIERLDHDRLRRRQLQPLAGTQHAVLVVALAGEPDAPGEHRQFAGAAPDPACLAGQKALAECVQGREGAGSGVRVHHQSPAVHVTMIVLNPSAIQ